MSRPAPSARPSHSLSLRLAKGAGLAAMLALAACSGNSEDQPEPPPIDKDYVPPCPQVQILRDASGLTLANGAAADPNAVVARAGFGAFTGSCVYDTDREEPSVEVEVDVTLVAERGPAGGNRPEITVPYFVAVLGADQTVIAKQDFTATLEFDAAGRAAVTEQLEQIIQLGPNNLAAGPGYQIMIGYQLTPEQLEFNRRNLARAAGQAQ
ncbi:MAG TPA: hypothetical protein VEH84_15160 [Alphaproteobacteria bacterium]|nr:hypothetical protein [Alphaproteobacteria bacterium]